MKELVDLSGCTSFTHQSCLRSLRMDQWTTGFSQHDQGLPGPWLWKNERVPLPATSKSWYNLCKSIMYNVLIMDGYISLLSHHSLSLWISLSKYWWNPRLSLANSPSNCSVVNIRLNIHQIHVLDYKTIILPQNHHFCWRSPRLITDCWWNSILPPFCPMKSPKDGELIDGLSHSSWAFHHPSCAGFLPSPVLRFIPLFTVQEFLPSTVSWENHLYRTDDLPSW